MQFAGDTVIMIGMRMHYYSVIRMYEPPNLEWVAGRWGGGLVGFPVGTNSGGS
jgi:hypothetical protein